MRILGTALLAAALGAVVIGCKKREPDPPADAPPVAVVTPPAPKTPAPEAARKRGTFTIGKGTTYVTGPLTATGHIDYVAALNERLSKGVTPEANANVAIWQVIGPIPPGDVKVPPGYFEKMSVLAPPAGGRYYVGLQAYANRTLGENGAKNVSEMLGPRTERPWTRNQDTTIADWLEINDAALTALREAVKLPNYYNPLLPEQKDKGTADVLHPGFAAWRELAGALAARAMLYLGNNQPGEAWQDLLTCYRLARQVGQGGTLIEALVGISIEQIAWRGACAFLGAAKPDAKTVETCLRDLFALPARRVMAEQVDSGERFWMLDFVMHLDRHGLSQTPIYGDDPQPIQHGLSDDDIGGIDWNPVLERANANANRLAAIFREPRRSERATRMTAFQAETRPHYERFAKGNGGAALKTAATPTERGRALSEMLGACSITMMGKVMDASDRLQQTFDTLVTAYALAWYQRTHGRYPGSLAKLAPTFLTAVPGDLFSEKDLIYKPDANGFLLYSVGVNGIDDGGRGPGQPPADDIAVRVPLSPKP